MNRIAKAGIGCGTLLLLAVVLFFVSRHMELKQELKPLSDPEREQLQTFLAEPLNVPAEWLQPKAYSAETKRLGALVIAAWQDNERDLLNSPFTSRNSNFARQRDLEGDAETTATRLLAGAGGLVINLARLTLQPDYDIGIFSAYALPEAPDASENLPYCSAKLMALQAAVLAKAGRDRDAVSALMAGLRLARRSAASPVQAHLDAMQIVRGTCATVADMALSGRDPVAVTSASIATKQLEPQVFVEVLPQLQKLHMIGILRGAKAEGYPIDIATSATGAVLVQHYANFKLKYPQWQLDKIGKSDPLRDYWQKLADDTDKTAAFKTKGLRAWLYATWLGENVHAVAYTRLREKPEGAVREVKLAKAAYDLARLALAQQRYLLEQRATVENPQQIMPAYIENLVDPFSGKSYKWSVRASRFYSIGPDGKDQELRVLIHAEDDRTATGDLIVP